MYTRDLIQYHGINNCPHEQIPIFRQSNIDYNFYLPTHKENLDQVVKVWITPRILEHKVLVTPIGESLEGERLTGHKLLLMGEMDYKVEYTTKRSSQALHIANTTFPFCGYVMLPENIEYTARVFPNLLIEDIYTTCLDSRQIYNNITVLFIADLC